MKNKIFALVLTSLLGSGVAQASQGNDLDLAKQCLAYGQSRQEKNSDLQAILSQAKVDEQTVSLNRYSAQVGSQYIASELVVKIHSEQENLGTILCLLNDDKPLYFYYQPFDG